MEECIKDNGKMENNMERDYSLISNPILGKKEFGMKVKESVGYKPKIKMAKKLKIFRDIYNDSDLINIIGYLNRL